MSNFVERLTFKSIMGDGTSKHEALKASAELVKLHQSHTELNNTKNLVKVLKCLLEDCVSVNYQELYELLNGEEYAHSYLLI